MTATLNMERGAADDSGSDRWGGGWKCARYSPLHKEVLELASDEVQVECSPNITDDENYQIYDAVKKIVSPMNRNPGYTPRGTSQQVCPWDELHWSSANNEDDIHTPSPLRREQFTPCYSFCVKLQYT